MRCIGGWASVCLVVACGSTEDRGELKRCRDSGCPTNGGATTSSTDGKTSIAGSGGTHATAAGGTKSGSGGVTSPVDTSSGDRTSSGGGSGGSANSASGGSNGGAGATGSGGIGPLPEAGTDGGCDAGSREWFPPMGHLDTQGWLVAPASDDGFQVTSQAMRVEPGEESFRCLHLAAPNGSEFDVGDWDSQLSPGACEFTLFRGSSDTAPEGTLDDTPCKAGNGGNLWLYSAAAPRAHLTFPQGVGMSLSARQRLLLDMHFINTGTDALQAKILLNATRARTGCGFREAEAQVSFNTMIDIPANGMQTVTGICHPIVGANYFYMTTLTRSRAVNANIVRKRAGGAAGETLVYSTDWDVADIATWYAPSFLTFAPGKAYAYSCSYQNHDDQAVTVGTSAETNEECMTIAYFFPASAATPSCN